MPHQIIDNRERTLVDAIHGLLPDCVSGRFAVGYFFISGLCALGPGIFDLQELRLLIGNVTSRQTIEQLAEGYQQLELVNKHLEEDHFLTKQVERARKLETSKHTRDLLSTMEQDSTGEQMIQSMIEMIANGRMKVRVYTHGRLHAKAYIFDFAKPLPGTEGIAIVGSSNLTLSGLKDNTELSVFVHDEGSPSSPGHGNHGALTMWFDGLWNESQEFSPELLRELNESWAGRIAKPYEVYMKTLFELVRHRVEDKDAQEIIMPSDVSRMLADFQRVAVRQAIQLIKRQGGCFVADVVGLGKSFIGAAIVKHFERVENARPLVICPKSLEPMWERYNEVFQLNARVLPMSMLREGDQGVDLLNDDRYAHRDFVLIDESHNFRRHTNQRYHELETFMMVGNRRACLLTATPRNSSAWDIYNQIKLFHHDDVTELPLDPPDLKKYFRKVDKGQADLQPLLRQMLIRRTRRFILRWYGYTDDGDKQLRDLDAEELPDYLSGVKRAYVKVGQNRHYFPQRGLRTLRYSIEDTYQGLYQQIRDYLGHTTDSKQPTNCEHLRYARYGVGRYVHADRAKVPRYRELRHAGEFLRGLIRTLLFKRFESSVQAFRMSISRMIATHERFLGAIEKGMIPAGEDADAILGKDDLSEQDLYFRLGEMRGEYPAEDFDTEKLHEDIAADINILSKIAELVEPITPRADAKLQRLQLALGEEPVCGEKCLIFTQYADTAEYLFANLNPGGRRSDIEVIHGGDKDKGSVVGRFAPKANPHMQSAHGQSEINWLISTDVLAEGLNLQDSSNVINYDLHWNPVRLIQRLGRIDRIGAQHEEIHALNFLPETQLEQQLGLQEVLSSRIQEIHDTIGEDARVLDSSEQLNEHAMYAIYEADAKQLATIEEGEQAVELDYNEIEEIIRSLERDDPEAYARISELPNGVRSGRDLGSHGAVVFCETGGIEPHLVLVDQSGTIISRELSRILGLLRSDPKDPAPESLPVAHNSLVRSARSHLKREEHERSAHRRPGQKPRKAQKYVLAQLKAMYMDDDDDEDLKAQISEFDQIFRGILTNAVIRELSHLEANKVTGNILLERLSEIYGTHQLRARHKEAKAQEQRTADQIICSMANTEIL